MFKTLTKEEMEKLSKEELLVYIQNLIQKIGELEEKRIKEDSKQKGVLITTAS